MTLYYCINDVLDKMENLEGTENRFQALIPVKTTPSSCNGHQEDAFTLSSFPKILDLTAPESAYQLARLIEETPLYNINIEIALDQALTERHMNAPINRALQQAFEGQPLPNTMTSKTSSEEIVSGDLSHPMLEHLEKIKLCDIYIAFLKALPRGQDSFSFEKNILGKHAESFLKRFDGYITAHEGQIKALILIAFGIRRDHDPGKPMETYVANGQKTARKMSIDEPRELLWAWLEAENYQMRRCRDIDRIMRVQGLPKMPNWVKTDVFCCLEKEAMKQVFAEIMISKDPELSFLEGAKNLKRAIGNNAQGHVEDSLQQLLSETLNHGTSYTGAAARFAENAKKRESESSKTGRKLDADRT